MQANDKQVGGTHYKSEYQHWDWVEDVGLGYLDGNATKYVARWRKKNGVQDLQKAQHYLEKLITRNETDFDGPIRIGMDPQTIELRVLAFAEANELEKTEIDIIRNIALWETNEQLLTAHTLIQSLINGVAVNTNQR